MNPYEQRSRESYNLKAADYENTADGKFTVKFKQALLDCADVTDGSVLLDVACGNGRLLHEFGTKAAICGLGVDIAENMVSEAEKLNPDMAFYVSSCEKLPIADGHCDIVTVCAAFHHFPDADAFAKEAGRVIKPGGRLYLAEVHLPALLRMFCNPLIHVSRAGDKRVYAPKKIVRIFARHGFQKISVRVDGNMQIVVLEKCGT